MSRISQRDIILPREAAATPASRRRRCHAPLPAGPDEAGARPGPGADLALPVGPSGGFLVASGYGTRAQWYRNILADPRVRFQVGRHRYQGLARPLPPAESGRRLAGYARRHPHAGASLLRAIGHDVDGSDAAYQRIGSDPEHGIPLVALLPR
jgi:deazaflavin-dependent oxidoreductase (nitroreductase family)